MKSQTPNPNGKHGKPISLAPHSVDDVLRKMLSTPVPSKHPQKPAKKTKSKK